MIAFGVSVSEAEAFRRYTQPGIELAREPDSALLAFAAVDTVARSNNLILDAAAREPELEALVLLHPHAEIRDRDFCAKVRAALADPDVAVLGCAGGRPAPTIAWWDGDVTAGSVVHAYNDHGGGEIPAFSWSERHAPPAEVDAVDPWVLVLSRWAVHNLRFDEELVLGHAAEVDLCWAARAAGKKVAVADLSVIEHRAVELVSDVELWTEAHIAVARKWAAPASPDEWQARARRAEAEREALRIQAFFHRVGYDARIDALQRELTQDTSTLSWRVTAPLRTFNHWRRQRSAA